MQASTSGTLLSSGDDLSVGWNPVQCPYTFRMFASRRLGEVGRNGPISHLSLSFNVAFLCASAERRLRWRRRAATRKLGFLVTLKIK